MKGGRGHAQQRQEKQSVRCSADALVTSDWNVLWPGCAGAAGWVEGWLTQRRIFDRLASTFRTICSGLDDSVHRLSARLDCYPFLPPAPSPTHTHAHAITRTYTRTHTSRTLGIVEQASVSGGPSYDKDDRREAPLPACPPEITDFVNKSTVRNADGSCCHLFVPSTIGAVGTHAYKIDT